MKTICSVCGREKVANGIRADSEDTEISHTTCPRCLVFQKGAEFNLQNKGDREDLKEELVVDFDAGVVWEGEYKINRPDEENGLFNKLVDEVRRERGEGEMGKRV